jgi:hypothetical protein
VGLQETAKTVKKEESLGADEQAEKKLYYIRQAKEGG